MRQQYQEERCTMECRAGCGVCCIVVSISSPIPGMPDGKPAGVRCLHLSDDNRCRLFGDPTRPNVCRQFQASREICGETSEEADALLSELERLTQ